MTPLLRRLDIGFPSAPIETSSLQLGDAERLFAASWQDILRRLAELRIICISVRELVEFICRTGDLGGRGEFVGPARALAGVRGHQRVQGARPAGYAKEVTLAHSVVVDDFTLQIKGRIDGLLHDGETLWLEEIKTVAGAWGAQANPLHWAQGKIYAFIYAHQQDLPGLEVRLTYLDLDTELATEFRERFSRAELEAFFARVTSEYLDWARAQFDWRRERDASIAPLAFPFAAYRPGQRAFAVAVYRTLARAGTLFAEAPTGIGKTVSVLFPAMKALGERRIAKIFYLTARTTGRAVAEKALADLRLAGLRCRSVTLTAKDKICFNNGRPCDPALCPFAVGYYDRNKSAMREALQQEALTRSAIEEVARRHTVCPFELSLDCALWVDVVIGDYNHVFDPAAKLKRFFGEETGDYAFFIDEAHNLVDRAREMFSADLRKDAVLATRRSIQEALPACAKALGKVNSFLLKLRKEEGAAEGQVRKELPEELLPALRKFLKEAEVWLAQNRPAPFREELMDLYFTVNAFLRTADLYDERFVTLLEGDRDLLRLRLFCLDPSRLLREALDRGKAAVFFSATLSPLDYFRQLLGGDAADSTMQLHSPFPPAHLRLLIEDGIQTNFKSRGSSYDAVAHSIAALVAGRNGNYLVYFPSYHYLGEVLARFHELHPTVLTRLQTPAMSDAERDRFLASFIAEPDQTQVGFAVLGGVFGEGIDLVGERLVGAVIVGVGLPQLCRERDLMRDFFEQRYGGGFDYAYTFPGMNRVLQAVGRVIRSEIDRGVVLLVDARFRELRYLQLFPAWTHPECVRGAEEIAEKVGSFWKTAAETSSHGVGHG
ncbi:MAG: ATP-dependent DNA helicase [Pedosphaera sp.]|nr:ATP-dependent DNA helicase [Pedosphaera sp.]